MKNILVPIEMHTSLDSVLMTAGLLAKSFGSYIEGMPLSPDLPDLVAFDMPVSWTLADQATWKELAEEARGRFQAFMEEQSIPPHQDGETGLSYGFAGDRSFGDSQVANYGRVFDVTILGRPGSERDNPRIATAEASLFESGRPVLLAPPEAPTSLGQTVVIAWNQSMESARTTAFAMPILRKATKVIILTIEAHNEEGPSADQLAHMLLAHGINVEIVHRQGKNRAAGVAYLEDAMQLGGDLLIKGAYSQSRLRQMIFGGATSHIMAKARLPVLMST